MIPTEDGWALPELDLFDQDGQWVWTICRWEGGSIKEMVNVETSCDNHADAKEADEPRRLAERLAAFLRGAK